MYACKAHAVVDQRRDRHVADRPATFQHLHLHSVARRDGQDLSEQPRENEAVRRQRHATPRPIDDPVQFRRRRGAR